MIQLLPNLDTRKFNDFYTEYSCALDIAFRLTYTVLGLAISVAGPVM